MSNSLYKVAGYLRLSREDGDKEESDSISSQRNIIARKVEELGEEFELIDFYIDDGYIGLNTDRPSFQRMLADCEKGLINAIITKDLSRLSRNSFEANFYIEKYFLENNIRYISVLDNVDTYIKNSNNDMIQFKTLINDWYSKDILENKTGWFFDGFPIHSMGYANSPQWFSYFCGKSYVYYESISEERRNGYANRDYRTSLEAIIWLIKDRKMSVKDAKEIVHFFKKCWTEYKDTIPCLLFVQVKDVGINDDIVIEQYLKMK